MRGWAQWALERGSPRDCVRGAISRPAPLQAFTIKPTAGARRVAAPRIVAQAAATAVKRADVPLQLEEIGACWGSSTGIPGSRGTQRRCCSAAAVGRRGCADCVRAACGGLKRGAAPASPTAARPGACAAQMPGPSSGQLGAEALLGGPAQQGAGPTSLWLHLGAPPARAPQPTTLYFGGPPSDLCCCSDILLQASP